MRPAINGQKYPGAFSAFAVVAILAIISLGSSIDAIQVVNENVIFEGNSSFTSSSYVRSGTGSQSNPYIISDLDMGYHNIQIKNTTRYVIFRNITFSQANSWAVFLYNSDHVVLENITTIGRAKVVYGYLLNDLIITESNFSSIKNTDRSFDLINCNSVSIQDSTFTEDKVTSAGNIQFNNQGSGHWFVRNYCDGVEYVDNRFYTNGIIANSTFIDSPVSIQNGNNGGSIEHNHFDSSSGNALSIDASYRLHIFNNYFHGTAGIFFDTLTWQSDQTPQIIENNTFESCNLGIDTGVGAATRLTYTHIKYNYFGNCSTYAIDLHNGLINRVWHNIFYHNAGTDNTTAGAQVNEVYYPSEIYKNKWTMGTEGNFWANHRVPDANNDGMVDVNYTLPGGGMDTRPFTNPYFDITRPQITITAPPSGDFPRSYLQVKWEASDVGSGIEEVQISVDQGPSVDVTGKTQHSLFLDKGSHDIKARVYDRGRLYGENTLHLNIPATEDVLTLDHPINGEYNSTDLHRIMWTVKPYFLPANITLEIDGASIYLPSNARILSRTFTEGLHIVRISVRDDDDLTFTKTAAFTVDLTPPVILLRAPYPGTVISNNYVTVNFTASDNIKLDRVEVRFDENPYIDRTRTTQFSDLLSDGPHVMNIRALDLAGSVTNLTIPIQIGGETGIDIIEPEDGSVTKNSLVTFSWEYDGEFPWVHSFMRIGKGPLEDIGGAGSKDIILPSDGDYDILIRLEDVFGNYIERSITIIRDTKPPIVDFIYPQADSVLNSKDLEVVWAGRDQMGLPVKEYLLAVDDEPFGSVGNGTSKYISFTPGSHRLKIRALDLAGNMAELEISFFIDIVLPTVSILSPLNGSMLKDSSTEIRWTASDDNMISNLTLVIDHRLYIDVLGKSSYVTTIGVDGKHTISLIAGDPAGNIVNITVEVIVDLLPPKLVWTNEPSGFLDRDWFNVSWTASDAFGIGNLSLEWDGSLQYLDVHQEWTNLTLAEGNYTITLKAIDLVGWEWSISNSELLVIDTTQPQLDLDLERSTVSGTRASVYWSAKDNVSGLFKTMIDIDGEGFVPVVSGDFYIFEGLKNGDHRITIRATDRSGNSKEVFWDIKVGKEGSSDSDESSGAVPTFVIIAIALVIVLLIVMVVGIVISKKRSRPPERKTVKRPERIGLAIPAAATMHSLPTDKASAVNLPPATSGNVETTEEGSGYIRPKTEKPSKKRVIDIQHDEGQAPDKIEEGEPKTHQKRPRKAPRPPEPEMEGEVKPPSIEDSVIFMEPSGDADLEKDAGRELKDEIPVWDEDDEEPSGTERFGGEGQTEEEGDVQDWEELDEVEELEDFDEVEDWEE